MRPASSLSPAARRQAGLAGLRQLAVLGLPETESLPEALGALHALIGSDTNHFVWTDPQGRPVAYRGEGANHEPALRAYFSDPDMAGPFGVNSAGYVSQSLAGNWSDQDPAYASSPLYQRVTRLMGGGAFCTVVLNDAAGRARGILAMMRERGEQRFSTADLELARGTARLLGQLFTHQPGGRGDDAELPAERGFAVLEADGRPAYLDNGARELLRLAGHPRQDGAAFSQWLAPELGTELKELCRRVRTLHRGQAAPPAHLWRVTPWGRFLLEARSLDSLRADTPGCVGLTLTRHLPAAAVYWRALQRLELPERQRQVGLEFARGRSLSDIAGQLGIRRTTVIDHVDRLYQRFHLQPGRDALRDYLAHHAAGAA